MKKNKIFLILLAAAVFAGTAFAGEVRYGSTPGSINYQGRLERDNAPVTGVVHVTFRIYNAPTGGVARWDSGLLSVVAAGGIFSANLSPTLSIFGNAEQLYLEVQIEGETLSPREAISSVIYALVAKKLEDGSDLYLSTLTVNYNVQLATNPAAKVGIGVTPLDRKFNVNGDVNIVGGGQLCIEGQGCTSTLAAASASDVTNPGNLPITAGTSGPGDILFRSAPSATERARMTYAGNWGLGEPAPTEKLYVVGNSSITGNLYMGGVLNNGVIKGANSETVLVGHTNDVIAFNINGTERMRVDDTGYLGVNNSNPSQPLDVTGNIYSNSGIRGGNISIGAYSSWTALSNEVRSSGDLLLQRSNSGKVGIGNNSPSERLHVAGTILSDYGVRAATGTFTGDVSVSGHFTANGYNRAITLSSTTVYGTLNVYGPVKTTIGGTLAAPAYLISTQTFSGQNTFLNQVRVSSETLIGYRVGIGMLDFDFSGARYLQIGDSDVSFNGQDALIYLVGGAGANAKIHFYRGTGEAARIETLGGNNLSFNVGGQKAYIDASNYKVYSSNFIVAPTPANEATTPAIYVSQANSHVGIGTTSSAYSLNVGGYIKLIGDSGIIFENGSTLTSGSLGSANALSNNSDAIILADADANAFGKVILKAGNNVGLVINSNGDVGMGTLDPDVKLQVIGGDVMIGQTSNPGPENGKEDLIIGGDLIVDGSLRQRSSLPVEFSALTVSGDVYLSTDTSSPHKTGIGTVTPGHKLDVQNGDINASGSLRTGGLERIDNAGNIKDSNQSNNLLLPNLTSDDTIVTAALAQTLTNKTLGAGTVIRDSDQTHNVLLPNLAANDTIVTLALAQALTNKTLDAGTVIKDSNQTHNVLLPDLAANDTIVTLALAQTLANKTLGSGTVIQDSNQSNNLLLPNLTSDDTIVTLALGQTLTNKTLTSPTIQGTVSAGTGLTLPTFTAGDISGSKASFTGSITASSGTFSSGVLITGGNIQTPAFRMTTGGAADYILRSDASGNASWIDPATGGLGDNIVGNEVKDATNATLTRSGSGTTVFPYTLGINLGNANTWTNTQTFNGGVTCTDCIALGGETSGNYVDNVTGGTGITVTGTAGEGWAPAVALTGQALALHNLATNGLIRRTGDSTYDTITDNSGNWNTHSQSTTGDVHGATASNVNDMIVRRGPTGNFSAGTITATLTGTATNVTGTVAIVNGGTGANSAANARTALDVPQNVGALANKIACWKDTNTLSYCTAIDTITANGDCTCN